MQPKIPYTSKNRIRELSIAAMRTDRLSKAEEQAFRDVLEPADDEAFRKMLAELRLKSNDDMSLKQFKADAPFDVERWVEQRAKAMARHNLLMSDQQLSDFEAGVRFEIGTRARYVGDTRVEAVGDGQIERPNGQEGTVTQVSQHQGSQVITFRPKDGLPELIVREFTPGWLTLERIPDIET